MHQKGDIMIDTIRKVLVVLNSFEKIDKILKKALTLSLEQEAVLEVLYVHEEPLFDVPEYFSSQESSGIDKEKIKKEIQAKFLALGSERKYAILVFINDTVDRVLEQVESYNHTLIVTIYHDKITEKILQRSDASMLVIKEDKEVYENIIMPVNLSEDSRSCINLAKLFFPDSKLRLLYDNPYVLLEEDKEKQKALFEALQKEMQLEGDYIQERISTELDFIGELYAIEKHLAGFINAGDFDLTVLYTHQRHYLFSNSLSFALLGMIDSDLLLLRSFDE